MFQRLITQVMQTTSINTPVSTHRATAMRHSKTRLAGIKRLGGLLALFLVCQQGLGQLSAWDFAGNTGSEATVAATTLNANLNATSITRGAGINSSTLGDTYASTNFTVGGTLADAITNADYLQFTFNPKPGYQASLSTLDANFRRSGTGPNNFQWQYSLDGFATAGINIGAPFTYNLSPTNGDPQTQINLGAISALQNVENATTITFRLYAWGATNISGTFALGRPGAPANDLAVGGTVVLLTVHNLTQNTDYNTIQSAINAANPNDVIRADAGTYNEILTINKSLVFRGNATGVAGTAVRPSETILLAPTAGANRLINLVGAVSAEFDGFLMDGKNIAAITQPNQSLSFKNNVVELDFSDSDNNIYFSSNQLTLNNNLFKAINGTNTLGNSSHIFMSGGSFTCTNNRFTSVDAINDYTVSTTSLPVWLNVTTNTTNAAINNNEFTKVDIGILVADNASNITIENNGFDEAKRATYTGGSSFGAGIAIFNTLTPTAPVVIRNNHFKNSETGIRTSSTGAGQSFPAANLLKVGYNSFTNISNFAIRITSDYGTSTNALKATCNWYGNSTGPVIATNPGASGAVLTAPANTISYANWLNYGTDISAAPGFQLPAAITAAPGSNTSAAQNHYRVLSNAVGCLVNNQTLTLSGTFNFGNPTALAEWAKGNNQLAGDGVGPITGSGDDYSIAAPDSVTGVTITAASLGSSIIQGPGDLAGVSLESALFFNNNDATSSFQNWTISNLVFRDFDVSLIQDFNGGNTTAYNNFKIINNQFDIPEDLNATFGGESAVNLQNIGIHFSFGANQEISGNIFNVEGSGVSDDGAAKYSSTVVMQSSTSGGTVYNGLKIKNNTITVTGNPDPTAPAVIRGIWENSHNNGAAIEISGNVFSNASGANTANLNRQTAMWVTSRSGATNKVAYKNNEVSGFKEGLAWLGGLYTGNTAPDYESGAFPVEVKNNKFDATLNAVTVRKSAGSTNAGSPGYMENNSFTNPVSGGLAIKNEGTGNAQSVCNWYGTTSFPIINTLNNGPVYIASILNSGTDGSAATGFQPTGTCMIPPVHNVTQDIYYTTIQLGVNGANNGDSITVQSGTYNEQVLVNKSVSLKGIGATLPVIDFTGTVTGKPTLIDVSVNNVKIDSFRLNVDLSKLRSAIIASGSGIDTIAIKNNTVDAYGTPAGSFGDRNAVSVNYGGPTNYRTASGGVNSITFTGNTVNGTGPSSFFRSGIATDESGGNFTGNTLQTISHDVLVRFANNGPVTIANNNLNGGGMELADHNAAAGTITVSGNTFTPAGNDPNAAVLRIKNNYNSIAHMISGNTFNYNNWAVSLENMNSITLHANTFSSATAGARAVVVNTKSITTNSAAIVQVPVSATITANNFNGTGTALSFLNHDSDNDAYGTFNIGTVGNENNFAATLNAFIMFDGQTGASSAATFPAYTSIIGSGAGALTTMACWDQNINIQNNKFDAGSGLQLPLAMNFAERTALETKLTHKPDNACLGLMTYFLPVHNLTQDTYTLTIQEGVNAANPGDVLECAQWNFNERVTIDRAITVLGVDSANTVINGAGLAGNGNGITINNGITNVTIKKLTVRNFAGASGNANAGIYAIGGNNNLLVDSVSILDNVGGSGFYANGPVNGVTITHSTSKGHTVGARGIVIWNGLKQNINISDNHVYGNNCCGIELQDGSATGVTMNNNNVHDNGDNGLSAVGLQGPGANTVSNNTVTNNGRFGIEIKNPNGSGAASGAGSIVISNNTVSRTLPIVDARDIAGIAVFRRGLTGGNVDVPYGVQVNNNNVAGYAQPSASEGFGIVLEGINHTATGNTLNGNDVGIQRQAGHLPYPGDGDQSNLADTYFGRGNSPVTCAVTISGSIFGNILANGTDTRNVGNSSGAGIVVNTNTGRSYCSIQTAINDPLTLNGHTITASAGTYNEQVLVTKSVTIKNAGATLPVIDFTGTVTGKPTLFDVSADNVVIDSIRFNVDLSKLRSAIIASGTNIDNIIIRNNTVDAYGTPAGSYGDRNAVSVNYSGPTNYRVASGGVNSITFTGNTVNGSAPASFFRSGISTDESGGTFTGNTLQTINHDVLVRFANNGPVTISNNNLNGGGVELSDQNAAAGTMTVSNNTFNGTFAISSAPGTAILRIKNNYNSIPHVVSGNTFTGYDWAISSENMNSITLNNNTFNTAVATAHALVVNTKSISSNSNTIVQVPVAATVTNNNFNGSGNALTFQNHDSDNDSYGVFNIGTTGNENNFASTLGSFIVFDGQTGTSTGSTFPVYPGTGGWPTTMACWDQNINIQNNKFDAGSGLQLPLAMNFAERTALETKLTHKPDNSCLGLMTYFLPVHNLTQDTYTLTIQEGVNAANPGDVLECAQWNFNERVTIDRPITVQGVDSANTVINGAGLAGNGNGITINNGVTNVTIKKLTVRNFAGASGNANAGIYAIGGNNNLMVDSVSILDNVGGSGFYANGPVNGVTITHTTSKGHTVGARGIVIWNGLKQNINISDNHVYGNNCCGIELQDGSATGVTMNNNNVHDNGDNGLSAVGLQGPGANTVSNNTVTNNGRFGIEIKNANGSGAASGAGSIVISNNTVSRTLPIVDARDIAGIAVFRRGLTGGNVDVPYGVQVNNNSVAGYAQPSASEGFGIVLEGINHTATGNTLNGNDVGIQRQAGHLPYPGDGDQSNLADTYFGRGNSPVTCAVTISGSIFGNILANGTDTRDVGNSSGAGIVVNTNTGRSYCSIQTAINDPLTLNGHTITASAGTYNEDVVVSKQVTILGAGYTNSIVKGVIGGGGATFQVSSPGVVIDGFTITRDGNNPAQWNLALNSAGVAIQGQGNTAELRNNLITGNRSGIDINNSNGNNIHNNIIDNNRTGIILRNQTDATNVQENFITNNWTLGMLFLDGSGGTNTPPQTASNSNFNNNNISGNWYGDVQDRQSGGAIPAPGTLIKNFDCNWYGAATSPILATANSTEPGYAAQIPVAFGGTAVAPGGQPNILGTASANIDFIQWLTNGTDNNIPVIGFQPVPGSCTGMGPVLNTRTNETYVTIQSAINNNLTLNGDTLIASAGTYAENVIVSKSLTILGPNANTNPCSGTRVAEAVVVPATAAIASGEIFHVAASNVTISGFTINGDNTAITSGFTSTNGADIDAAEGITVYETGVNNLKVTNNIIQNLSYFGITLYDYPAAVPSSGHVIADNKIQDLGTYDAASTIDFWGGGILLYNNQYAAITNNCMSNVRLGVQTGNFYQSNPGAATYQVIANNTIQARRRGIFHNLFYQNASPYTLSGNTITGLANANETANWDGILLASMQATASTSSNNNINGAAITAIPTTGISVWNCQVPPLITLDSISGVGLGINVNNFEGYPSTGSDAGPTSATIDSVYVTGASIAGIRVNDNTANSSNANTVAAEIKSSTITGGATGILVFGPQASANIHDNTAAISGAVVGIDIDSATVSPLYRNTITGNGTGIRVRRNGTLGLTTENFITNNTTVGIQIDATAGAVGNINNNDISGNTGSGLGINNLSALTVNATCNWWGVPGGNAILTVVGSGAMYAPWLHSGVDLTPAVKGFQPAGVCSYDSNLYVNDNLNTGNFYTSAVGSDMNPGVPAAPFRTIGKAIAVAQPTGNTVWVDPGQYAENLVVNKELTFKGRQAGNDVNGRFGAFVSLKADTTVESVVTTPVNDPLNNPNDLVKVSSNNISFDGFTFDGNNPNLTGSSTVQDNLSLDMDARRGLTNIDAANGFNPVNNLVIKNNIVQNLAQRGISLANNGPLSSGILIDSNLIRNYGWDAVNGGQAIILFTNAYATITNNTIDVTDNNIGIHLQNFYSNGNMNWSNNKVTVGQDAIGIHANLFYAPAAVLNIQNNTVNARTGVTGASDYTWGINVWSVQVGSTVNVSGNTVGNSGGELGRGINLWNLPTSNTVTVSGGTVARSLTGINLDNVDPYFGVGSNTMVNVSGNPVVTATAGQTGIRARSAMVNAVAPGGAVTLNLSNATVNATGTATGVTVEAPSANPSHTATVYLAGGSVVSGGSNTPVLINGNQSQLYAATSAITAPASGANNAIQFSGITSANTRENLVIAGGTTIGMNGNTAARAFAAPQYSIVEMDAAAGWAVPSRIAGGLQTVQFDGRIKFSNGTLRTTATADTIEFAINAPDIMTGPSPEKASSYILGRAKMLSRTVNNGAIDMLGVNLTAETGIPANVGNLVLTRTTTTTGGITPLFPASNSIRTVWNIQPSNNTASRTAVQFRYLNLATNINGQNPASIYAYRNTGSWQKISASLSSSLVGDVYTTTSFHAPSFSPWTLSSQSTATLPDLTPSVFMDVLSFATGDVGVDRDFIVLLNEVAGANTTGTVSFRISKPGAFNISFVPTSGVSNVFGGTPNSNSDFTFTDAGGFYLVTTTLPISAFSNKVAGFRINRKPGIPANSTQSISIQIVPGSGGDNTNSNNLKSLQITAN